MTVLFGVRPAPISCVSIGPFFRRNRCMSGCAHRLFKRLVAGSNAADEPGELACVSGSPFIARQPPKHSRRFCHVSECRPKSTVTVCPILPASNRATHYRHQPYATCAPACCGGSPRVRGHAALSARPEFGDVSLELHGGIVFRIPRARARPSANSGWRKGAVVEPRGFEPLTSAVRLRRSPN